MSTNSPNYFSKINDLYNKTSFLDKYGKDVWMTVIIALVFFTITTYFYVLNNLEPIKADWENQKCSPSVIPFAGIINKGPNDTAFDFTGKNFTHCVQGILTNITAYAFQPIYYIMNNLTGNFSEMITSLNSIRGMFDKIRNSIKEFSEETMGRTLNITMPLVQFVITIKNMGAQVVGILTASLFTLFGSFLTLQSLFALILQFITTILIALVALIITFLIISAIPIFGSWAIPVAAGNIAIMIAILVPTVMMQIFMSDVLSLSSESLPSIPRCFSERTVLDVRASSLYIKKHINELEVGDVLKDGATVTAIMKFSADKEVLYNLQGIIVTGNHRVFHKRLGWLKVKEHPERILLTNYTERFVYCLGTDTKTFTVENNVGDKQVFSDWDDIDEKVLECVAHKLPPQHKPGDIHTYLDNGLVGSALVKLKNGTCVELKNIQVENILAEGEKVLGIIKIEATNLHEFYEYIYQHKTVLGCNITVVSTTLDKTEFCQNEIDLTGEKYLYHLLTDTGYFTVNGLTIHDYNYGIDKYLL